MTARTPALPNRRGWFAIAALFALLGTLNFLYRYLDDLAREHHGTLGRRIVEEATGSAAAFALLPFVFALCRRLPWTVRTWPRVLALQFAGAVAFSLVHTTLLRVLRDAVSHLSGAGPYDYGLMTYRYPMELSNDLFGYAVVVGAWYVLDRIRRAREDELRAAHLQTELAEATLENLQLQLQPHFLFNTLNTISAVMYEDVRVADRMIGRLSDLLRATLSGSGHPETTLAEELRVAGLYVDIMRARLEDHLDVRVDVGASVREALVPTLILQPLLENAIKHGFSPQHADVRVDVAAERTGDRLAVRVADTGAGLRPRLPGVPGIGLANTRHRLRELYGDAASVHVAARSGGGAEVLLTLPYRTREDTPA